MSLTETLISTETVLDLEDSPYLYLITFRVDMGFRVQRRLKEIKKRIRASVSSPYWNNVKSESYTAAGIFELASFAKPVYWFPHMEDARYFVLNQKS